MKEGSPPFHIVLQPTHIPSLTLKLRLRVLLKLQVLKTQCSHGFHRQSKIHASLHNGGFLLRDLQIERYKQPPGE